MRPANRPELAASTGFSLLELLVAMALLTLIMGATMAGLSDVMKGNELVMSMASMNNALRAGVDVMVRDLLQVGSGLPSSHVVSIPNGDDSLRVKIPGPPGTAFQTTIADIVLPAVMARPGQGPTINGIATDVVSVLMADNSFLEVRVTQLGPSHVVVHATDLAGIAINIATGADRVVPGQLMLISKGGVNTLVQVTNVNTATRRLTFADGDSLNLNQSDAETGNLPALNAEEPSLATSPALAIANTRISRMRMITYYLDNTASPGHPRLVRRINNGDEWTFNNDLGIAVAVDAFNLQLTFDINNGAGNPSGVEMNATDLGTGGACSPLECAPEQIRKVTLRLTSRSPNVVSGSTTFLSNTLESQVSLRAMAFVDRYR